MSKAEKAAAVEDVMKGVPYSAAAIKEMKIKTRRFLAKGLGINTFGMKSADLEKAILAAQKKAKPSKK